MNKEELTTEDVLNVTGSMFSTMLDYVENSNNDLKQLQQENKQLKDNWNKLKEIIDVKMYNMEYLLNLCGYKVDRDTLTILDIIKKEMKELESGDSNDKNNR